MSARAEAAGKKGACPSCQAVMEIPVDSLEGKLAAIREGKAIVLITKAERHQANSAEYYRFRCRVCDHGLSIPTDKAHKKIQCTNCDAVSRLGLNVLDLQANENQRHQASQPATSGHAEIDEDKIQFECKDCRQVVRVSKEYAGKKGRCPNCRATVGIPYYSTVTGFRVKPSAVKSPFQPLTPLTVNLGGTDLLKNFVPESPLKADAWTPPKNSPTPKTHSTPAPKASGREGVPWENPPEQGGRFWATCKLLLFSPNVGYQQMYDDDGLGNPIGFAVIGHFLSTITFALAAIPVLVVACLLAEPHMEFGVDYTKLATQFGIGIGIWFGIGLVLILVLMFCFGAMLHAAAFVAGGTEKPFETTNRMLAYSLGSCLQLLAIPFLGPLLMLLFLLVQITCGLSKSHEKPMGQAIGAVLLAIVMPSFFVGLLWMMSQ